MKLEIFTLCETCMLKEGSLTIARTFDAFFAPKLPYAAPPFYVAVRVVFGPTELGGHKLTFELRDPEGVVMYALSPVETFVGSHPDVDSMARSFTAQIPGLIFPAYGRYSVNLSVDDTVVQDLQLTLAQRAI